MSPSVPMSPMMPMAPEEDDAELIDTCGDPPDALCEAVLDRTDNSTLAQLSDWFLARPLAILLILLGAWLLAWIARRAIRRLTHRLVAPEPGFAEAAMRRVGRAKAQEALDALLQDPRRHARASAISYVLGSSVTVVIWVVALILVLGRVGIDLAPIIAGAGIAGVALGFGAQALVQDCIAGLFMLIEDQYGIGDVIDLGEAVGVVEEITLRVTVLRSLDGTVWHVPNGQVQRVGNMSQLWSVALVDVDVTYHNDLEQVRTLIHQTAADVCEAGEFAHHVLDPPEVMGVEALGVDGVTIRLRVRTAPGEQWALQRSLRQAIKAAFEEHGIEIALPRRTVWMRVDSDDS